MSASAAAAARRRCVAPLLAALLLVVLLVQPQPASAQPFYYFHFHFLTGPDAVFGDYKYTVVLDADLTATKTAAGRYRVVSASGNRTISFAGSPAGELVPLSHTVNFDRYEGIEADNLLTYPATEYGFVDNNGIGFTLEQAQVIVPGYPASNTFSVFNAGFHTYSESSPEYNGVASSLTVEQYTPPPPAPPADDPPVVDDPSPPTLPSGVHGDPVFVGFRGQRFTVDGLPQRVYTVLSLPALQLNTRFIPLAAGDALNVTEQRAVYRRQSKLLSVMKRGGSSDSGSASNPLPATTTWSHAGLYMGETGVQVAGRRLHVVPGAYVSGFEVVQLDGAEVAVSNEPTQLSDGSTILRSTSSVVRVDTAEASFSLVNSDHFLNIHAATLHVLAADIDHVDGLLGQTASSSFKVQRTASFKQHVENDFLLPEGADVWSTAFEHNRYEQ